MTKNQFRVPYELSEQGLEYRDHLIEELKSRTGANYVNIIAYKENQLLEPRTISPEAIVLEGRVGNHIAKMIIPPHMMGIQHEQTLYYFMKELSNRMMDTVIKSGVQGL